MANEQTSLAALLPGGIEWEDAEVALYLVPVVPCPAPSAALVDSVRLLGVLNPILLVDRPQGYDLRAGRRRVAAARLAGLTSIKARVAHGDALDLTGGAAITLIENEQRSANPAAELAAMETLFDAGHSERAIAAALGIPRQTVRKRLRLLRLNEQLAAGFRAGKISASAAESALRLPAAVQAVLAVEYGETGKLTLARVEDALRVRSDNASDALPDRLFDLPGLEAAAPFEDPLARIRAILAKSSAAPKVAARRWLDEIRAVLEVVP